MWFAKDILWDLDLEENETYEDAVEDLGLPDSLVIPSDLCDFEFDPDGALENVADYLSDTTGFCVHSFYVECDIPSHGAYGSQRVD